MPGLETAVWLAERKLGTARNYSMVYVGKQRAISSGLNCECLYVQAKELSELSDELSTCCEAKVVGNILTPAQH